MKKIRIAQIGVSGNSHGGDIFQALTQNDRFEIAGYALPEGEREKFPDRMPVFANYPEMRVEEILNDPTIEAVSIETEEIYLTKYALLAAQHHKHIHMEKPGGTDLAAFTQLIETVKQHQTVFHVGYMYRYNPVIRDLLQQIREGEFGEILSVEAQMSAWHADPVRAWMKTFPGGMMFFLGCHLVDLLLQIQGEPDRIFAFNKRSQVHGISAQDSCTAVFEYARGVSFLKTSDVEKGGFLRRQLVVTGTKKTIEIKPLEYYRADCPYPKMVTDARTCDSEAWAADGERVTSPIFDRYAPMMDAFGKMAAGEMQNPYTYDYEFLLYKTILQCCGAL